MKFVGKIKEGASIEEAATVNYCKSGVINFFLQQTLCNGKWICCKKHKKEINDLNFLIDL